MKKSSFLNKLKTEKTLMRVEPSEEISASYLIKSDKCIRVARLAYDAEIYENAVSEAYYSIYNSVLSLFFLCGIKCENHSAAVILIKEIFGLNKLHSLFSDLKRDRIDNQYYVSHLVSEEINKKKCSEVIKNAQHFNAELKVYSENLKIQDIKNIRKLFEEM